MLYSYLDSWLFFTVQNTCLTGWLHLHVSARPFTNLFSICFAFATYKVKRFGVRHRWVFLLIVCILTSPAGSLQYGTTRKLKILSDITHQNI